MTIANSRQSIIAQSLNKIVVAIAILTICFGVFLRIYNLENKIYWLDETFTSVSVSPYNWTELESDLITGKAIDIATLHKYQFPGEQPDYIGTIQGLIEDEPQHTPLYFLSAKFWLTVWGNSIFTIRSLSVLLGILCIPLFYILCNLLFNKPLISYLGTAFFAVSPFHILYSQEARPFILWIFFTLLSSVTLLKAQKESSVKWWAVYSVATIGSLYTFLFSLLTCFAQFIYILCSEKFRLLNKTVINFVIAAGFATLCFLPWIVIIAKNPPSNYTTVPPSSFLAYPKAWVRHLSLLFADFNINESSPLVSLIPFFLYLLILLAILAYAVYYLGKNSQKKSYFFVYSLLAIPFFIVLLYDFGKGGQMTIRASYLIPSLIGAQIIFAYLLGNNILKGNKIWLVITGILLSISIASGAVVASSPTWWIKDQENIHHQLANVIDRAKNPLIVSDVLTEDEYIRPISVSHYLTQPAKFMFVYEPTEGKSWNDFKIPNGYSDIFLYAPSQSLKDYLQTYNKYALTPIFPEGDIYCDCPDEKFFKLESNQN